MALQIRLAAHRVLMQAAVEVVYSRGVLVVLEGPEAEEQAMELVQQMELPALLIQAVAAVAAQEILLPAVRADQVS